jgi:hypothetical protein
VRVAHLVHELLGHRVRRDAPPGAGVLRDDERAVRRRLDDRVADVGEVRDVAPVVEAVAARALRAALDDVPGDDPAASWSQSSAPQPNSCAAGPWLAPYRSTGR